MNIKTKMFSENNISNNKEKTGISFINPFTLSFENKELNEVFYSALTKRSLKLSRLSILFAMSLYVIFGFLDDYILPSAENELVAIRIIGLLIFFIILVLTFHSSIIKKYQLLMTLFITIGGMNVVWLVLTSERHGGYSIYAGIILTIIYAHSLLRLRFIYASLCTWYIVIFYGITTFIINKIPVENIINNWFFIISANILGMFASYGIEFYLRSDFLKAIHIKKQSRQLEKEFERKSRELESAKQIQLSMLPQALPEHPFLELSVSMKTASEIGGDYYDFHLAEDHTLTFAIGDATGHGAQAGAMVTATKMLFSNYAHRLELVDFLKKADHSLKQIGLPRLYMAFAIGRIKENILEIAGVGLPPLIIHRAASNKIEKINLKGLPLGSYSNFPYIKKNIFLLPGDTMILMTDGFPELFNKNKEVFGYERIDEILPGIINNTPGKIINKFKDAGKAWMKDHIQEDDITFLVLKMKEIETKNNGMQMISRLLTNNFILKSLV